MVKRMMVLLLVMSFIVGALGLVYAADPAQRPAVMVKCCLAGKCVDASKNDCDLKMGTVVSDCKLCKSPSDPNK